MEMREVTIVGGGLGGLALGIALRRHGVPVEVVEAGAYPRHRVCGEFLSGIDGEDLDVLGIGDLFEGARRPQETVWYDRERLLFRGTLPVRAFGVSRFFLDSALSGRFTAMGGRLSTGRRFEGDPLREGAVIASGRPAGGRGGEGWLGLKGHYAGMESLADLEVHLGDAAYVGVTVVEGGWTNVTGLFRMTPSGGDGKRGNILQRAVADAGMGGLAERLGSADLREGSLKGVTRFELGWQKPFGQGIRIGDAAAMIPPVTGNGMTMALQSARGALGPLVEWSRGALEWSAAGREVAQAQQRLFGSRLRWAAALQAILMQPLCRRLCGALLAGGWVSFETLYRKVR
jgi:flavin-dependent dehydrogenase